MAHPVHNKKKSSDSAPKMNGWSGNPATQKKWWCIMLYPPNSECPAVRPSSCPSVLGFRALTLVPFDLIPSNFGQTLISGKSGMGLQVG